MKQAKRTITRKISEKTDLRTRLSRKALQVALDAIKKALGEGKKVDLGKLGTLVVVNRKQKRMVQLKLRHLGPGVFDVHKKHKKSVRLLGGKDLSENPLPTIVHARPEPPVRPRKSFAIAYPSWRRRRIR